ncbi:DUF2931 family protein [Flavobacterium davisii]|uniref:DUF2931 family protein n=1 Tax=Flavobacterium columnare TaxID=996 RepID=A0A8G0P6D3_9FLAO|nr:DUF2931 family protein [Flavobacterium davisii]QYS89926.1 DUF2931 family protein [Flavobacterium davisii]
MYTKLKKLFILLFVLVLAGCKHTNKKHDKMTQENFSYGVGVTSPTEYPTEVHIGYLLDQNKKLVCGMPRSGTNGGGWTYKGKQGGMGGSSIPYYLNLTYVAYAEKKFYTVEAVLPADKILAEFKKGYDRMTHKGAIVHETYDVLTVGAAPGGCIVVWLSGSNNRVEICRLQAKETVVDKNDFLGFVDKTESQQEFFDTLYKVTVPDSIKTEIKQKGIPYGLWDQYREKYKYRFVLKSYDEKDKFTHNYYLYYNAEADEVLQKILDKQEYMIKGIPYTCNFIFTKYSTEIVFNDREMLQVFGKLKAKYPEKPLEVVIKPTFMYDDMKILVKCATEEIPLTKYKVVGVWGG